MWKAWSGLALLVLTVPLVRADEKAKASGPAEEATIESRISKDGTQSSCFEACTVNFRRELKVPFEYLNSLGTRIHEARKLPDPVELAAAAQSLAVAEQVAGKKASVTSEQVMTEAIQLAKLRGNASELKAIAIIAVDGKAKDELVQLAEAAEDRSKEPGEASKYIHGTLLVTNHSHECLRIYVDGRYVGTVHEHETDHFHVHAPAHENHLDAYCEDGGELVQHAHYHGHSHGTVTWHIHH